MSCLLSCKKKTKMGLCNLTVREKKEEKRCFDFEEDMEPSARPEWEVPARQSVNTLPLNHGPTYWSTQMKSVSFFPDHKLIKNPLCWHQTVWHKLKLIHNYVCIDFYPAFAGYIRAWLVSFCSGVYSKCNLCLGLPVQCALRKKIKKHGQKDVTSSYSSVHRQWRGHLQLVQAGSLTIQS